MTHKIKVNIILGIILATFIAIMMRDPIIQNIEYHKFADDRAFLGINNFGDVFSNIVFIFTGFFGLMTLKNTKPHIASLSWTVFFVGVILVAPGSAWYHWNPNNSSLVWDRLPMTIAFMGLFTAMMSTFISKAYERILLLISIIFGLTSVLLWDISGDLRLYYFVQIVPLVVIPTVIILFKSSDIKPKYLIFALLFYVLAKAVEFNDRDIFTLTNDIISGHTLKHLSAAVAPLILGCMLKKKI
jgi:ABC-type Fe3+-siderophore transport system permease subunit